MVYLTEAEYYLLDDYVLKEDGWACLECKFCTSINSVPFCPLCKKRMHRRHVISSMFREKKIKVIAKTGLMYYGL